MDRLKALGVVLLIAALAFYGCSSDEEKKLSHLEKGKQYFEKGEYKSAQIEFKNAIQIDPDYANRLSHLASDPTLAFAMRHVNKKKTKFPTCPWRTSMRCLRVFLFPGNFRDDPWRLRRCQPGE